MQVATYADKELSMLEARRLVQKHLIRIIESNEDVIPYKCYSPCRMHNGTQ